MFSIVSGCHFKEIVSVMNCSCYRAVKRFGMKWVKIMLDEKHHKTVT